MSFSELPPRVPISTRRPGYRRSASNAESSGGRSSHQGTPGCSPRTSGHLVIPRAASLDAVDTSHLEGITFECEKDIELNQQQEEEEQEEQEQRRRREQQQQQQKEPLGITKKSKSAKKVKQQKVGIITDDDCDDGEKLVGRHGGYSAEEIALRRFMTKVAWGPGLDVVKHNRGRGRSRRVLKFNDEVGR